MSVWGIIGIIAAILTIIGVGGFYDVWNDAMENKPLKNVSGSAAQAYKVLKAALFELKYPKKNN